MRPIRCYAGQFFGGYPTYVHGSDDAGRAQICGIKLVVTAVTADVATELELEDWHALKTDINRPKRTYQGSKVNRLFHHKASADDSSHFFEFNRPIDAIEGIKIRTHTNCRPIIWVK